MINAILLLLNPASAWERLMGARRGVLYIFGVHVLPLLLLVGAVEAWGLMHWGKPRSDVGVIAIPFTKSAALQYALCKLGAQVAFTFIAAFVVNAIGKSFRAKHGFTEAFTLVAFTLAPYYSLQIFNALPFLPDWVVWIAAAATACAPLYQGVPKVLEPDPPQTFGIYFMGALTLVGISGLVYFICHTLLTRLAQSA